MNSNIDVVTHIKDQAAQYETQGQVNIAHVLKQHALEIANCQSMTHFHFGAGKVPIREVETLLSTSKKIQVFTDTYYDDVDHSLLSDYRYLQSRCKAEDLDPTYRFKPYHRVCKEISRGFLPSRCEQRVNMDNIQQDMHHSRSCLETYNQEIATYNCIRLYLVKHLLLDIYLDVVQFNVSTFYVVMAACFKHDFQVATKVSCVSPLSPYTKFYQALQLQNNTLFQKLKCIDSKENVTETITAIPPHIHQVLSTTSMAFISENKDRGDPFEVCRLLQSSSFTNTDVTNLSI